MLKYDESYLFSRIHGTYLFTSGTSILKLTDLSSITKEITYWQIRFRLSFRFCSKNKLGIVLCLRWHWTYADINLLSFAGISHSLAYLDGNIYAIGSTKNSNHTCPNNWNTRPHSVTVSMCHRFRILRSIDWDICILMSSTVDLGMCDFGGSPFNCYRVTTREYKSVFFSPCKLNPMVLLFLASLGHVKDEGSIGRSAWLQKRINLISLYFVPAGRGRPHREMCVMLELFGHRPETQPSETEVPEFGLANKYSQTRKMIDAGYTVRCN